MSTRKRSKLAEFHIMKFGAKPAWLVAVEQAIASLRFPPHMPKRLMVLRAA